MFRPPNSTAFRNEHISKRKTSALHHKKCGEWPRWNVQCGTLWIGAKPCRPTAATMEWQNNKKQKQGTTIIKACHFPLWLQSKFSKPISPIFPRGRDKRENGGGGWVPFFPNPTCPIFPRRGNKREEGGERNPFSHTQTGFLYKNLVSKSPGEKWGEIEVSGGLQKLRRLHRVADRAIRCLLKSKARCNIRAAALWLPIP